MTNIISRLPQYSDLDLDFITHPTTKDVVKKIGIDSIKRSVRNLVMTNYYEKPWRSGVGSNIRNLLFDNVSSITANLLIDMISQLLLNYEPRISVTNLLVRSDIDRNGYDITIKFIIINNSLPVTINLFLERIR